MPFKKKSQYQLSVLSVLLVIILLLYTVKIYSLQIVNAEEYTGKADGASYSRTAVLKAPRGEILDCYGRQIAVNRDGYNIVFNKAYVKEDMNDVILSLIRLLKSNDTEWFDELPITNKAPFKFIKGESTDKLISKLKLAHYATAQDCFMRMVEKYELEKYSVAEQRLIMGVRYGMDIADFSISYPYTFAEDVPTEIISIIMEMSETYPGVSAESVSYREYADKAVDFASILKLQGFVSGDDIELSETAENVLADNTNVIIIVLE